jgi:hypothetical protein
VPGVIGITSAPRSDRRRRARSAAVSGWVLWDGCAVQAAATIEQFRG